MRDVVVIGGGLTGLACAHRMRAGGASVTVLEAEGRGGGFVGTLEVDGFRFELGPNTVQAGSVEFRRLCGELGLADRLTVASDRARTRWLYRRGQLRALPSSPPSLIATELLSLRAKLRLATEPLRRWRPPAADAPEPTLAELLDERLGPEPTALFAGAFARGIYAGDHTALGARSAFPRLWQLLEEHGGIVRGLRARGRAARRSTASPPPGPDVPAMKLLSLPGGLGELVDALVGAVGDDLRVGAAVDSLAPTAEGWIVRSGGEDLAARAVVLAVPAHAACALLAPHLPADDLAFLRGIRHAGVRLAHLGFAPGTLALPEGFGYLVPPAENGPDAPRTLGTIFASNLFDGRAPAGGAAVSCFYGHRATADLTAEGLIEMALEDLARALGLPRAPAAGVARVVDWPQGIAQYEPEHDRRVRDFEAQVRASVPGLHLAGSYTRGVSVEQVIARGREVAAHLLAGLPST